MLWSRFFCRWVRPARRSRPRPFPWTRQRLAVETLEGRSLPSVLYAINANDSGPGSLRECISVAQSGDTIKFDPTVQGTIHLQSSLSIDKDITIADPGPSTLTLSGENRVLVFSIISGNTVTISGLSIRNARSDYGAIDINGNSNVTLLNDVVAGNTGLTSGGGISNFATLTVDHTTVTGNHGASAGGILNASLVTAINSTFAGNRSDQYGGGICETSSAALNLTSSTVAANQAAMAGGGIYISEGPQYVNVLDTIIAKNTAPTDPDLSGTATSVFNNFVGLRPSNGTITNGYNGNIVGVGTPLDPQLGPLQDNGGPTPTMAPAATSPVIGKGLNNSSIGTTDQRGLPRVVNGRVDIGAVEYQGVVPVLSRDVFAIGLDDQVYAHKFDANGNPTGGYFLTQPGKVKGLTVGHTPDNNPELFAIGLDNQVYAQKFDTAGNSAGGYFLTQPGQVKSLSASHDASGNPELFAVGLDDQVYAQKFDPTGSPVGGYFLTQPGKVKAMRTGFDANGNPEVCAIGLDDQVYIQKFDGSGSSLGGYVPAGNGVVKGVNV